MPTQLVRVRYSEYLPLLLAGALGTSVLAAAILAPRSYHLAALLLAGFLLISSYIYSRSYQRLRQNSVDTSTIKKELELKSTAIESSMDGMAILNRSGEFIYMNQAHAQVYGYDHPSELIGKSWQVLYDQDNLQKFGDEHMPKFHCTGKLRIEAYGKKRDGTIFPQEVSLTSLKDGGLICVIRDISERKLVEHSAEGMALFAALSPYPVLRFDPQGRIILANPRAIDALGIRPGSLPALGNLIPGIRKIDFGLCIARGSSLSTHGKIGVRHYHFTFRGVPSQGFGHLYCIDITLLRQARKRLVESKRFLRKVVDSIPNLIFVKDAQGKFSWANQGFAELLGTTPHKIIGKVDSDFESNPKLLQRFKRQDDHIRQTRSELRIPERLMVDAYGKSRWLHTIKRPLELSQNQPVYVLGVLSDTTYRKKLEEQLLHAQKMEAVGQLAGGIAHDFNNLLTGIVGYANLLKSDHSDSSKVIWTAEMIESIANRASQLTQQLLGFARKGKHQNTPVDLNAAITETVAILSRTIEKDVVIEQNLNAARNVIVGDPLQIQQILLNLALNARDAMRPETGGTCGGIMTIATRDILDPEELPADLPNGSYTEVSVSDTGCGIGPAIIDRIFDPFFTTKRSDKGSGMGLAMVYGIIKNHGGSVQVESSLGKGTVFRAYLPICEDLAGSIEVIPTNTTKNQPIRGKGLILLVDDHHVIRDVTAKLLSALGYSVATASDGSEALAYYKKNWINVDLVIMDMVMPGMSAQECFTLLREINPRIKAILSTGYANNNLVQDILDDGMLGFIQKPYQIDSLAQIVANILQPQTNEAAHH